ncbi:MAG: class I SAM-dependent methyltransferase [Pirellulaceae bacterium]|jgi:ubiquinone/menaquinone biosynthesis C-methylase UbiE|nr:class I SAM-dependent methyltransferase [Pirellulaceae bacterium]MDP7015554.1 class I SAM-dependent methyltransferase [Pirellulaceae bacterium]
MTDQSPVHDHNRRVWNQMVQKRKRFTRPAKDEDFQNPLATVDAIGWLGGDIRGRELLCLAAGGGRQSALYAAAGAKVTVVDISPGMLEVDREVAAERGLDVRTVEASMDDLSMLGDAQFDIVIHPVSTCYVPDIRPVYREVARVMVAGGLYINQHKQPASLQADVDASPRGYEVAEPYYRTDPLPAVQGSRLREEGTLEFLHRWEQLIGELCRAGFVIEDLVEPLHAEAEADRGSFAHRSSYFAPYVRIKARRVGQASNDPANNAPSAQIWTPHEE